jgi:hypothetical protein
MASGGKSGGWRAQRSCQIGIWMVGHCIGRIDRRRRGLVADGRRPLIRGISIAGPRNSGSRSALGGLLGFLRLGGGIFGARDFFGQHLVAGTATARQHRGGNGQHHQGGDRAPQDRNGSGQRGYSGLQQKWDCKPGIASNHLDFLNPARVATRRSEG